MIIGVKFCGGCNPRYDRKKIYDILVNEFKNIKFITVESSLKISNDYVYDLIIVIFGCHVSCTVYTKYKTKTDYILIKSLEDLESVKKQIYSIFNEKS